MAGRFDDLHAETGRRKFLSVPDEFIGGKRQKFRVRVGQIFVRIRQDLRFMHARIYRDPERIPEFIRR